MLKEALDTFLFKSIAGIDYFTSYKNKRSFLGHIVIPDGFGKDEEYVVMRSMDIQHYCGKMQYLLEQAKEDAMLAEKQLEEYKAHFGELTDESN